MAKLGDVCTIVSGTTPKTSVPEYWDGTLNWITPAELNEDTFIINESQRKITEEGAKSCGLTPFPAGTVILSSRAPIGKTAIAGTEMYCNQGFKNLICSDVIFNQYLFWFLRGNTEYLNSLGRGATFKEISKKIVQGIEIPLPSIERQKEIASVLDKISSLISLRKQQLEKLDELVKARFVEMFGTAQMEVAVVDVCTEIVDCPHSTPKYEGQLIHPAIRTTEIKNGYIDWDTMKYVSREEYAKRISRLEPKPGDIVYGREGTYGNACILPNGYEFCLGQRVMLFRADESKVLPEYLLYALLSDSVKRQADEKNIGATVPHVNVADAKQFQIKLPALEGQRIFSDLVAEINKTKSTFQRSLDNLEMLKNALMQKYFG